MTEKERREREAKKLEKLEDQKGTPDGVAVERDPPPREHVDEGAPGTRQPGVRPRETT